MVCGICFILLLLSKCPPLECCCVHNMSPFVSSSGLSPGSREAKVQRAKVCFNCTEPSVARSSCWSLPVGRYLSLCRYVSLSRECNSDDKLIRTTGPLTGGLIATWSKVIVENYAGKTKT